MPLETTSPSTKGLNKTAIAIALIVAVSCLLAFFFYLTNNRYYILTSEEGWAYEVDRRTGQTWILHGITKRIQEVDRPVVAKTLEAIPYADKEKITGHGSIGRGSFAGKLYNGSDWTVREVVFEVTAWARPAFADWQWSRLLKEEITIEPLSTTPFSISVAGDQGVETTAWKIVAARGWRPSTAHISRLVEERDQEIAERGGLMNPYSE